ncbi:MAG: hypothetical protein JWO83_3385 [Caulobacteraceae bacterium]|nr:hypothetical protein [Caulobacteraceae bacterium]
MVRAPRNTRSGRSDRDGDDGDDRRDHDRDHEHRRERYDDPEEHLEIERRRFHGGLKPTPELYALAREQWYRLPGALVRPSMDTNGGDTNAGDTDAGAREPER